MKQSNARCCLRGGRALEAIEARPQHYRPRGHAPGAMGYGAPSAPFLLTEDNARFLLLAIVLLLYMLAGAVIFQYLEADAETKMARDFWRVYADFRRHYCHLLQNQQSVANSATPSATAASSANSSASAEQQHSQQDDLEDGMERVHQLLYAYGNATTAGIIHKRKRWDFAGSFHFVGTIVSTIGK